MGKMLYHWMIDELKKNSNYVTESELSEDMGPDFSDVILDSK